MKQHITPEQVNELSHAGKEKLLGWLLENKYATYDKTKEEWGFYTLSIGQMIEFLVGKQRNLDFRFMLNCHDQIDTKTMCDELWEEIKKTLDYKY